MCTSSIPWPVPPPGTGWDRATCRRLPAPEFLGREAAPTSNCHTRWIAFERARWAGLERLGRHQMYGWDCCDAIPIDWHLTAVFPTCEHEGEEFVYSEDLWATHGLPELWVSGLGACGHRVDGRGAANVLNTMIRRMIAGDLKVGDEHPALFDSGAI